MVVGFSYVVQASHGNASAEITKELRQCFDTSKEVTTPSLLGDKIQIRNDTIYKPLRSLDAWKKKYERQEQQATSGFFSPVAQPYETFGELELNLRELVVKTLGANTHPAESPEKGSLWSKLRNNRDVFFKFEPPTALQEPLDDEVSSKSAKTKEHSNKDMTLVIGERLSLMKCRLAAVRAGQSYEKCLREENQRKMLEILEDQKNEMHLNGPHGQPFIRKKSVLASRKSVTSEDVAALEDATKLDASELQEYHKRKCKSFVATLKALYSLLCCVYHLKTRDLRTKVPLSKDYIKVINTEVPIDTKGKPLRHQRLATTAQHTAGSTDSFHIRGSDSDRVTSTAAFPNDSLPNVFRPPTMESGSNLEKQGISLGPKRFKNVLARPNTLEDNSETGSLTHHEHAMSRSGASRGSFQATFNSAVSGVKTRRGVFLGMLANTGNNAEFSHGLQLPIWQQIATNERSDKKTKPGALSAGRKTDKQSKRGLNLEQLREEFSDAQKRCSKRLSEDMTRIEKLEKCSFHGKLNALKLSHLIEHDVMTMRRATNKIHQDYHDENVRPSNWFEVLCEQAMDLHIDDDDEVESLLEKFAPFSKDDVETVAHVKSKLCLVVQSLPLYELCQLAIQEAIKFFLETILASTSNTLSDWMAQRKIKPSLES